MRLWGRRTTTPPEAKQTRTGTVVVAHAAGRPVWTPRSFAGLARAGYLRNPVAFRCVRVLAEAVGSLPWVATDDGKDLDHHPLLTLLRRPNARQSGAELVEAAVSHLLLAGNAYLEAVTLDGEPREIHVLRPDRMAVVPDARGWPASYEYTANGRTVRFEQGGDGEGGGEGRGEGGGGDGGGGVRPILHLQLFHPLDDHYGFAPIEAAAGSLDLHNAATAWNKALLDNSARPSGALVYKGEANSNLSDEQFERLREELSASFSGGANAGRPLLLEGGLAWQAMSLSPQDMDFQTTRNAAARDIALAFGVPPMVLGIPGDNTYANYKEANLALWRGTVLPLAARLAASLGGWLAPAWAREDGSGGLRLTHDLDAVEAISAEREALWRRVGEADFITPDEKRLAVGYGALGLNAGKEIEIRRML